MAEMEWFIKASAALQGHEGQHGLGNSRHSRIRIEDADQGLRRDHRHSGQPRDDGRRPDRRQDLGRNSVRQADLRLLDERLRLHRHPSSLQRHRRRLADRFHGRAKARTSPIRISTSTTSSGCRSRTFTDGKLYQLPDQQFANLYWFRYDWFQRPELKDGIQEQVRLRARRARQLVGLRRHRRLLHQHGEGNRRPAGLWPHGLWQEGSVARLALHRRLAVDGRQRRQAACRTASRSTSGASARRTAFRAAPRSRAAATPTGRRRCTRSPSLSSG